MTTGRPRRADRRWRLQRPVPAAPAARRRARRSSDRGEQWSRRGVAEQSLSRCSRRLARPQLRVLLEAVWRDWSWADRFPSRDELVAYFDHVTDVLDLGRDIDLDTRARAATFDPSRSPVDGHDRRRPLVRLPLPAAVHRVRLEAVHPRPSRSGPSSPASAITRRGGRQDGVVLDGRRVGVIGTGASGVQVVQEAARCAGHLTVFQRSPVMAIPMQQRRLDPVEQRARKATYPDIFRRRNSSPTSFADIHRLDIGALDASAAERDEVYEAAWRKGGFHFWAGTFNDVLTDETANRTAYDFWRDKTRARITDADDCRGARARAIRRTRSARSDRRSSRPTTTASTSPRSISSTCGDAHRDDHPDRRAHDRGRGRARRAGAGDRLRRQHRRADGDRPARPRRSLARRAVGARRRHPPRDGRPRVPEHALRLRAAERRRVLQRTGLRRAAR